MSVLDSITNIKIPYPTEGVIRTAQLDDTVAPDNSVQLAVNMNFDRLGAMQTRPGITQYADDLAHAVKNYGTLRNAILPAGYTQIFQLGGTSQLYNNTFGYPAVAKVSSTKLAVFWADENGHGQAQNFALDEVTGTVTPLGVSVEFEATLAAKNRAIVVSDGVVLNTWEGVANAANAMAFDVSSDQIVAGAVYNFDTAGFEFALASVNSTHVLCFYSTTGAGGIATILAVNLTTLAVTEPGSPLTFDAGTVRWSSCAAVDSTHFINFWSSTGVANAQCFTVNTGTWAITAVSSPVTNGSQTILHNCCPVGDGVHFLDVYRNSGLNLQAQMFAVNVSSFVVSLVGTPVVGPFVNGDLTAVGLGDQEHYVAFYSTTSGNGHVQMLSAPA